MQGKLTVLQNTKGENVFPITSSEAVMSADGVTTIEQKVSAVSDKTVILNQEVENAKSLMAQKINFTVDSTSNVEIPQIDEKLNSINNKYETVASQLEQNRNEITDIKLNFVDNYVNLSSLKNVTNWADTINNLIANNYDITLPSRTIAIDKPIIWNGKVDIKGVNKSKSVLKASLDFVGSSIIDTTTSENGADKRKFSSLANFTIDASSIVGKCLHLKNGEGYFLNNLIMKNATDTLFEIGDGTNQVNACNISDIFLMGDDTYLKPFSQFPDYCLKINNLVNDNNFNRVFACDSKLSIFCDNGGNNRYSQCHGWGTLADEKYANYIFEMNGNNSELSQCFADSPRVAGYYIGGWGIKVENSKSLIYNTENRFADTVYVEIKDGVGQAFFNNCTFFNTGTNLKASAKINGSFRRNIFSNMNVSPTTTPVISYYSDFRYPIFNGNNSFTFTFPTPISDTIYSVFIDTSFDNGGYSITKTVNGFTVNFKNTTTKQEVIACKLYFVY